MAARSHLAELHQKRAETALEAGDLGTARDLFEKALACLDDPRAAAVLRISLGSVLAQLGAHDEARRELEAAVSTLEAQERRTGPRSALARALNQLGLVAKAGGKGDEAHSHHERAYRAAAEAEDRRQRAVALRNLATLDREDGLVPRAVARLEESAELQSAEGDRRAVALLFRQIRALHLERGDARRAFEAARKEIEARQAGVDEARRVASGKETGRPAIKGELSGLATALLEAGSVARRAGEAGAALSLLGRALEHRRELGDRPGAAAALASLGHALLDERRPRAARERFLSAREALGATGDASVALLRAEIARG
ncbi:tetratricopeptide repeat protein, partial [bacterium]|nr:tetratricopeptide repeat protein [bacterium]